MRGRSFDDLKRRVQKKRDRRWLKLFKKSPNHKDLFLKGASLYRKDCKHLREAYAMHIRTRTAAKLAEYAPALEILAERKARIIAE